MDQQTQSVAVQHEPEFVVVKRSRVRAWLDAHERFHRQGFGNELRGAIDLAQAVVCTGRPASVEIIIVDDGDHVPAPCAAG
jgi:hypothetical protein